MSSQNLIVFKRTDKKNKKYMNIQILSNYKIKQKLNEYVKDEDNFLLLDDYDKDNKKLEKKDIFAYNMINLNGIDKYDTTGNKYLDNFIENIKEKHYIKSLDEFLATDFIDTKIFIENIKNNDNLDFSKIYKDLFNKYKNEEF